MQRKKEGREYRRREAKGWVISLTCAIVLALVLRFFIFEFIHVDGPSMQPLLWKDQYVFMEKVSYRFNAPMRGDIVVCSFPGSADTFIKRVIGLPGEIVSIQDGTLYIDGAPNYDYFEGYIEIGMTQTTVPENSVLVMGDNRNDSHDSRAVGPIAYKDILGKALFVVWPLDSMHGL